LAGGDLDEWRLCFDPALDDREERPVELSVLDDLERDRELLLELLLDSELLFGILVFLLVVSNVIYFLFKIMCVCIYVVDRL